MIPPCFASTMPWFVKAAASTYTMTPPVWLERSTPGSQIHQAAYEKARRSPG